MSASLVLHYRFAPGKVVPELHVATGDLPKDDLKQIENWLRENYREMAGRSFSMVSVPGNLSSLPAPVFFRIETVTEQEARNPMLRLEYQSARAGMPQLPVWAQQLVATLESQLAKAPETALPAPARKRVAKAVAELQKAAANDPQGTAQELLQGFVAMRRRQSRLRFVARRRKLRRTMTCLAQFQETLPKMPTAPRRASAPAPEKEKLSLLQRIFQ